MIFETHAQGSPEWLQSRAGVITASRFKDACDTLKSGAPSDIHVAGDHGAHRKITA